MSSWLAVSISFTFFFSGIQWWWWRWWSRGREHRWSAQIDGCRQRQNIWFHQWFLLRGHFVLAKWHCAFVQICSFMCIFRQWSFRKCWSVQKILQNDVQHVYIWQNCFFIIRHMQHYEKGAWTEIPRMEILRHFLWVV